MREKKRWKNIRHKHHPQKRVTDDGKDRHTLSYIEKRRPNEIATLYTQINKKMNKSLLIFDESLCGFLI